jgi:hypothetical protein
MLPNRSLQGKHLVVYRDGNCDGARLRFAANCQVRLRGLPSSLMFRRIVGETAAIGSALP